MICCKIVANYNSTEGNFSGLIKDLGKKGEILFQDCLFFSDCVNNIDKKFISKVLKKNNYKEFFINEYTEDTIGNSHYWLSAKQVAAIIRSPGWQELAKEDGVELTEELILDTDWWRHYMDILTDAKISELYGSL